MPAGRHSRRWNKMTPMSKEAHSAMFALNHEPPLSPVLPGILPINTVKTCEESKPSDTILLTLSTNKSESCCEHGQQLELHKTLRGVYNSLSILQTPSNSECTCLKDISASNVGRFNETNKLEQIVQSDALQWKHQVSRSDKNLNSFKQKSKTETKTTKTKPLHMSFRPNVFDSNEHENSSAKKRMNNTKTVCECMPATTFCVAKPSQVNNSNNQRHSRIGMVSQPISSSLPTKKNYIDGMKEARSLSSFQQSSAIQTDRSECTRDVRTTQSLQLAKTVNVANNRVSIDNVTNNIFTNKTNGFSGSVASQGRLIREEYREGRMHESDWDYQRDNRCILASREKTFRISAIDYDCRYDFKERLSPVESFSNDETLRNIQEIRSRAIKKCRLWLRKYHVDK